MTHLLAGEPQLLSLVSPDRCQRFLDFRERTQSNFTALVLETETTAYVTFELQAIFGNEIQPTYRRTS